MSEIKTISSKYVIQRLYANHKINNSSWEADAEDWIGQAVRFIGKHIGFRTKVCCNVLVENYKCCYPLDFEGLLAVVYKGALLPLSADLSNLGVALRSTGYNIDSQGIADNSDLVLLNQLQAEHKQLIADYAITPTQELQDRIDAVADNILVIEESISTMNVYQQGRLLNSGESYATDLDVLKTSFETGYISLVYKAFKLDEEGYPLILDNEYYIQAIEWYILLMLTQKGWEHKTFTYEFCYEKFWGSRPKREAGWRKMASNNARIPRLDELERFTRMWEQFKFRRSLPDQLFHGAEQPFGTIY